jgi:hypothetical protein
LAKNWLFPLASTRGYINTAVDPSNMFWENPSTEFSLDDHPKLGSFGSFGDQKSGS